MNLNIATLYGSDASTYYLDSSEWNGQSSYHTFGGAPQTPQPVQPLQPSPSSANLANPSSASQAYLHESLYDGSPLMPSLPPMSSFRAQSGPSVVHTTGHATVSPSSAYAGQQATVASPSLTSQSSAGDTLTKALVNIYSSGSAGPIGTDHTPSSYSGSTTSTPVSSPQTWPTRLAATANPTTFGNTSDATDAHLHTLVLIFCYKNYDSLLSYMH
jgi:hypothetical protein